MTGTNGIQISPITETFTPRRVKYRAQSLEYFRLPEWIGQLDWILHLDDKTLVGTEYEPASDLLREKRESIAIAQVFWK